MGSDVPYLTQHRRIQMNTYTETSRCIGTALTALEISIFICTDLRDKRISTGCFFLAIAVSFLTEELPALIGLCYTVSLATDVMTPDESTPPGSTRNPSKRNKLQDTANNIPTEDQPLHSKQISRRDIPASWSYACVPLTGLPQTEHRQSTDKIQSQTVSQYALQIST